MATIAKAVPNGDEPITWGFSVILVIWELKSSKSIGLSLSKAFFTLYDHPRIEVIHEEKYNSR